MVDLRGAVDLLVREPGVGSKVETSRSEVVRRLYLGRIHYFVYDRVRGNTLESRCVLARAPRSQSEGVRHAV